MRSYRPEELFDDDGALLPELAALAPEGDRRMSANPHANGGLLLRDLRLPDFRDYAVDVPRPARTSSEATACSARFLRDVDARQPATASGSSAPTRRRPTGCSACSRSTDRALEARALAGDDHLAPDGRVMEVLTEHLCQGWLEGYLLTGRHGLFNCYEAFIHIVDSMFNQHAKWLKVTPRDPVAPADRVAELPADLARLAPGPQRLLPPGPGLHRPRRQQEGRGRPRLPAAGRQHAAVGRRPLPAQPPLRQRDRRRQAARARLPDDGRGDRALHARASASGSGRATTRASEPDVVLACAGDMPTLETLAAAAHPARATCPTCGSAWSTSST